MNPRLATAMLALTLVVLVALPGRRRRPTRSSSPGETAILGSVSA